MESHTIIDRYLKDEIINGLKYETIKTHRAYLMAFYEWIQLDSDWTCYL